MRKVMKNEKTPKPPRHKKIVTPSHLKIFRNTPIHQQTQPPLIWKNGLVQLNLFAC